MTFRNCVIPVLCSALAIGACESQAVTRAGADVQSASRFNTSVLSRADAVTEEADWGTFIKYFEGRSFGTADMLSGVAEIKPGFEIHPPHSHAEEEFLMVIEGTGTWSVNGERFAAGPGDMLYADPWDVHGIKNTGDTVLTFVFWKARAVGGARVAPLKP